MRRAAQVVLAVLCGAGVTFGGLTARADEPPAPAATQDLTLTLDEARLLAREALYSGRFEMARQIAMGLLEADPEDAYAYAVLAAAHARMRDVRLARAAARLAYKYSDTPVAKFGAARTAASIAYQQKRPTISQAWLRLAATHTETEAQEKQLAADYGRVKSANPLRFNINLSIAPSDNVNSGTDNVLEVVNGVPTFGFFRGSSRALSGTVGVLDVRLRYRLAASKSARTTATGRFYTRQIDLSSSAREIAPNVENGDFAVTYIETGLDHQFALGAPGNAMTVTGALGASWTGGDRSYDFAKLGVRRDIRLGTSRQLSLSGAGERRFSTRSELLDTDVVTLGAYFSQRLERGGRVNLGLTVQDVNGEFVNSDYRTASFRASYTFGKQIGPVQITTGVTLGYTDYDVYRLLRPVAGGRQDESIYGDVSLFFADYDFAGFAPTVQIRTGRRTSNVNRFEISETTVTVGIQSKF